MTELKPIHLGQFILKKIRKTGLSTSFLAREIDMDQGQFTGTLSEKKQYGISLNTLIKFSKIIDVPVRELAGIQNRFRIHEYLRDHGGETPIARIKLWKPSRSMHETLHYEYLSPMGLGLRDLCRHIKIEFNTLRQFFCKGVGFDSYELLGRVGEALGTGPMFWYSLQTKREILEFTEENPWATKYLNWNHTRKFPGPPLVAPAGTPSPGQTLRHEYLKPSGISEYYWAGFFSVRSDEFKKIVEGKKRMSIKFIVGLTKAFEKDAAYWLNLQNEFYCSRYLSESSPKHKIKPMMPLKKIAKRSRAANVLLVDFLNPSGMTPTEFGRYINGTKHLGNHLIAGKSRIDTGLAIKIGQALGTDPMMWLDLQMEEDLARLG